MSGNVTLDGQPLDRGSIRFEPQAKTGAADTSAGATIAGGRFETPDGQGLPPGMYRVSIKSLDSAATPTDPIAAMDAGPQPSKERIPARYNVQSTLTADVTADGKNEFEFPLTSQEK